MPAIRVSLRRQAALWLITLSAGLLSAGLATAQVMPPVGYPGGYPGGVYTGGGYPTGGGGIPIPMPSRAHGQNGAQPNSQHQRPAVAEFSGQAEADGCQDHYAWHWTTIACIDFRRTSSTKFYKGGDEVKNPKFNPGDQLSMGDPEDNTGYLTAVNVYWEKAAAGSPTTTSSAAKDDKVPDAWADAPATQQHGTQAAPPPAKPDADDPGPPTLKARGRVRRIARESSARLPSSHFHQRRLLFPPPRQRFPRTMRRPRGSRLSLPMRTIARPEDPYLWRAATI